MTNADRLELLGFADERAYRVASGMQPGASDDPRLTVALEAQLRLRLRFPEFLGHTGMLSHEEGYVGHPYQPTPGSGVTLDGGIDLHAQTAETLELSCGGLLLPAQLERLRPALGKRGPPASALLHGLLDITWTPEVAGQMLARLVPTYWRAALVRSPALAGAPAPIQTAVLSLVWNCGAGILAGPLREALCGDWRSVRLLPVWRAIDRGAPTRRKREADYLERA